MIKALIVDDEYTAIELLQWLLHQYCPDITAVQSAAGVDEAAVKIRSFQPDIVFLDIKMPGRSGFDLLLELPEWKFEVIFTTAFNEYAIQAIKFSALDYLLKPIDADELVKAVSKYKMKKTGDKQSNQLLRNFIRNIEVKNRNQFKLAVPTVSDIKYFSVEEILRLEAERNYTRFHLVNNKYFVSAKTLKEYEDILTEHGFIRVHKSHLVNRQFIESYDKQGFLLLNDNSKVEVSRRRREFVMDSLGQ
jgi:two-component system LytT family response regulator